MILRVSEVTMAEIEVLLADAAVASHVHLGISLAGSWRGSCISKRWKDAERIQVLR